MTDLAAWLRAEDLRALTLTLYGEGRGEPLEGRVAIGNVIRNRARTRYMGKTVAEVCLWPWQFSCWNPGADENHAHVVAVARALADGGPPPWSALERAVYDETCWIASGLVDGMIRDNVKGSRHYMTVAQFETDPKWAKGRTPTARAGHHVFFAGIK
jgi:spore germination cell wall hydrolase CwlJ-like protein